MSENKNTFHDFALNSALFKGRSDWYFCFLKSERIAHVLTVLSDNPVGQGELLELSRFAGNLPKQVAFFAAGKVTAAVVLADIFSLLAATRLAQTRGSIEKETARIIGQEYQTLLEKFAASVHLSPFASAEDFAVPSIETTTTLAALLPKIAEGADTTARSYKGQNKGHSENTLTIHSKNVSKEQQQRTNTILDFVLKNKGVSIKDIRLLGDPTIQSYSEKTIQRELGVLVGQGLIKKVGERRWSLYVPA